MNGTCTTYTAVYAIRCDVCRSKSRVILGGLCTYCARAGHQQRWPGPRVVPPLQVLHLGWHRVSLVPS